MTACLPACACVRMSVSGVCAGGGGGEGGARESGGGGVARA